jgi:hypothetical protein
MPARIIRALAVYAMLSFPGLAVAAYIPTAAQEIDVHPAHTHEGTCPQPGAIVSTLSPVSSAYVVDGESMVVPEIVGSPDGIPVEYSSTTLPVPLSEITSGQYIVDVKVSEEDQANSVACGEIGGLMLGTTDLPIGLWPIDESGHYGTAWLHDNGDGTTNLSIALIDVGGGAPLSAGATIPVSIENFAFSPSTIAARAGDTIVFTNNDNVPHTVTQSPAGSGFQSDPIAPGTTYTTEARLRTSAPPASRRTSLSACRRGRITRW